LNLETVDTVLSIAASVLALASALYAKETRSRLAKLEQRINTSSLTGGQHVQGSKNTTVGGNYNAP